MCRLSFIMRVESFSHHRIDDHNKDSQEHQVDSNELQQTTIAPITSEEQVDSEENKIVKRDVLQPSTGRCSKEEDTVTVTVSSLANQSDEDNVVSKEIKSVKRYIQVTTTTDGNSSEEDVATVATISLADLSVEDDVVDSEENSKVKRNIQVEITTIDHSSEEETNVTTVNQMNQSDEHDYDHSAELFKREIQQLTAEELEMLFQLFNSEEKTRVEGIFIGYHSDEHDHFDSIEKQDTQQHPSTADGHSSEENTRERNFNHSFENSIEDVLEQLELDAKLPSTALRI